MYRKILLLHRIVAHKTYARITPAVVGVGMSLTAVLVVGAAWVVATTVVAIVHRSIGRAHGVFLVLIGRQ